MRAHRGDQFVVLGIATALTLVIAAPVLAPVSPRIFGAPTVGWHHDPFTMMALWSQPLNATPYLQPMTDLPARWLVQVAGRVQGYNWLVLLSFPFAAVAAHALARHLAIGRAGAAVAALIFAFSPFHLAHAAYHPHIAQVQWIAVYVLTIWYAIARGTVSSLLWLVLSTVALVLSNFYAGFIMAVLTPVLIAAGCWLGRERPGVAARVARVTGILVLTALAGLAAAAWRAPALLSDRSTFAAPRDDVSRYSARSLSYVMPPVAHPVVGAAVARAWHRADVDIALLEHQVTLGVGVLLLGAIAVMAWVGGRPTTEPATAHHRLVPPLVMVAAVAAVLSAAPTLVMASGLHDLAPMFRSYARFGVVVQLMAALLAGIGVTTLWRRGTTGARVVCTCLLVLIASEYAVAPSAMSRSVWPTAAHRWVHDEPGPMTVLACAPDLPAASGASWLTKDRITGLQSLFADCGEPQFGDKLAATGITHLLVSADADDAVDYRPGGAPDGLRLAAQFDTVALWTVTAPRPPIYVDTLTGWFDRERDAEVPGDSWRWMGDVATWTIVNTGREPMHAQLTVEVWAFHHARTITVAVNAHDVESLQVTTTRRDHVLRPVLLSPGTHTLTFRATTPPDRPADLGRGNDQRPLSMAVGRWHWTSSTGGV